MTREEFLSQVGQALYIRGFQTPAECEGDREWVKHVSIKNGGRIMYVNGQPIQEPESSVPIQLIVRSRGICEVSNEDGSHSETLEQWEFKIKAESEEQGINVCTYYVLEDFLKELKDILHI